MNQKSSHELFAGIKSPRSTRERILFVATDLFYTHGFNAVGLDQILAEADLTKTTFYNHFDSKDDLVEEAIRLRDEWETEAFIKAVRERGGYDPRSLLLAIFDVMHEWFTGEQFRGCLFLMAVTDYPLKRHPAHQAGARHFLITQQEIEKIATAATIADPAEFAKQWTLLIVGAIAQHLINPDQEAALAAKTIAETLLNDVTFD